MRTCLYSSLMGQGRTSRTSFNFGDAYLVVTVVNACFPRNTPGDTVRDVKDCQLRVYRSPSRGDHGAGEFGPLNWSTLHMRSLYALFSARGSFTDPMGVMPRGFGVCGKGGVAQGRRCAAQPEGKSRGREPAPLTGPMIARPWVGRLGLSPHA